MVFVTVSLYGDSEIIFSYSRSADSNATLLMGNSDLRITSGETIKLTGGRRYNVQMGSSSQSLDVPDNSIVYVNIVINTRPSTGYYIERLDIIKTERLPTYTITYNLNGGIGTLPDAQSVNVRANVLLSNANGITRAGYTFDCWNTNNAGTGTDYKIGSIFSATNDITLYAKWKPSAQTTPAITTTPTAPQLPTNPLVGSAWEYINRNDSNNRYRLSFSRNSTVTFEVYSSNNSSRLEQSNGTYTLQGNTLTMEFIFPESKITERFTYSQASRELVNSQNRAIVYRLR